MLTISACFRFIPQVEASPSSTVDSGVGLGAYSTFFAFMRKMITAQGRTWVFYRGNPISTNNIGFKSSVTYYLNTTGKIYGRAYINGQWKDKVEIATPSNYYNGGLIASYGWSEEQTGFAWLEYYSLPKGASTQPTPPSPQYPKYSPPISQILAIIIIASLVVVILWKRRED